MGKITSEQFEEIRLAAAKYMGSNPDDVIMMISDPDPALVDLANEVEELKQQAGRMNIRFRAEYTFEDGSVYRGPAESFEKRDLGDALRQKHGGVVKIRIWRE